MKRSGEKVNTFIHVVVKKRVKERVKESVSELVWRGREGFVRCVGVVGGAFHVEHLVDASTDHRP